MPTPAPIPQTTAAPAEQRWIAVARLLRPQGRRGELLADPLTDLADVFATGRSFRLASGPEALTAAPSLALEDCWRPTGRNAGRLVLKLCGVDSINAAEELEGKVLFLPESDLPALGEDIYLVRDLIGCTLFDNGHPLGTISDIQFPVGPDGRTRLPDAADLLVLDPANATPGSDPVLVPFVKAWLQAVDLPARRIAMTLPPGLLDHAGEGDEP